MSFSTIYFLKQNWHLISGYFYQPLALIAGSSIFFLSARKSSLSKITLTKNFLLAGATATILLYLEGFFEAPYKNSFFICFLGSLGVTALFARESLRSWSLAAIAAFVFLKIGCFANGCCFGLIDRHAGLLTVQYLQGGPGVVSHLWVPLIPLQLYEAFGAALVLAISLLFESTALPLILFAALRFSLDFWRGERTPLLAGVSFHQCVAFFLFGVVIVGLMMRNLKAFSWRRYRAAAPAAAVLLMTVALSSGCVTPDPPGSSDLSRPLTVGPNVQAYNVRKNSAPSLKKGIRRAIFVYGNELTPQGVDEQIQDFYHDSSANLEELMWWWHLEPMRDIYTEVVRIRDNGLSYKNIVQAINYLEAKGDPYDVFIFSHGIIGHLTAGSGGYFWSKDQFALFPNKLQHMGLVFMQACQSQPLADGWVKLGAEEAISFKNLTFNYFWLYHFLRWYRWEGISARDAFDRTNRGYRFDIKNSLFLTKAVEAMDFSIDEYLQKLEDPEILERR